jgi:type 1 fimbriae regulatory protein FimE
MFSDPSPLPISAKSDSRFLPPVKKTSERDREYLRPKEVEATISAAKKIGRHGIRDAAIISTSVPTWTTNSRISRAEMVTGRPE